MSAPDNTIVIWTEESGRRLIASKFPGYISLSVEEVDSDGKRLKITNVINVARFRWDVLVKEMSDSLDEK